MSAKGQSPLHLVEVDETTDEKNTKRKRRAVLVQPYTLKELAAFYRINYKTFSRILKKIKGLGKPTGRLYMTDQVTLIFKRFPLPYYIYIEDIDEREL